MTDVWIEKPDKAALVAEAGRAGRRIEYHCPVAGEWRTSATPADSFAQWGPGPTTYRIPNRG